MIDLGYKYNMTDLQASLGIHQLKKLGAFVEAGNKPARHYDEHLDGLPEVSIQKTTVICRHARHLYPIVLDKDRLNIDRDKFIEVMKAENIGCGIHYTALHRHPYYRDNFNFDDAKLPNASYISDRIVSLPLYPSMTEGNVPEVVQAVRKIVSSYKKQ